MRNLNLGLGLSRKTRLLTDLFRFEVLDAGGSSHPAITKSGTAATWYAYEGGTLAQTFTANNAPTRTFASGSNNYWELYLPDDDPETITEIYFASDIFTGAFPNLSPLTGLTYLSAPVNNFTSIYPSQMPGLTFLHVGDNDLTVLDVSQNTALTAVHCYKNDITTLDVSQNASLTTLVCWTTLVTVAALDAIYSDLNGHGLSSGTVNTSGGNDPTDGASNSDVLALQGRSWTVTL